MTTSCLSNPRKVLIPIVFRSQSCQCDVLTFRRGCLGIIHVGSFEVYNVGNMRFAMLTMSKILTQASSLCTMQISERARPIQPHELVIAKTHGPRALFAALDENIAEVSV